MREETIVTNESGNAIFRGFYGKYDVEIEIDGKIITKEVDLSKNGENVFEIMI